MNRLQCTDRIKVEIFDENGLVDTFKGHDFHNVTDAIGMAYDSSRFTPKPAEDYVYRVIDETTGTVARYRINAGGNVKILPEEGQDC